MNDVPRERVIRCCSECGAEELDGAVIRPVRHHSYCSKRAVSVYETVYVPREALDEAIRRALRRNNATFSSRSVIREWQVECFHDMIVADVLASLDALYDKRGDRDG